MNVHDVIKIYSSDTSITRIIKDTIAEFMDEETCTPWDINNGRCLEFADVLIEKMGGESDNLFSLHSDMFYNDMLSPEEWDNKVIRTRNGIWSKQMLEWYGIPPVDLKKIDDLPIHEWVCFNKKHYDAEAPQGVTHWYQLPIFSKFFMLG